jgi:hypothetical protein
MDALAESDRTECIVNPSSYAINDTSTAVSMDSTGSLEIDTSIALAPTSYAVTVIVGSQTSESFIFSVEVFDCTPSVTFPDLLPEYIGKEGMA